MKTWHKITIILAVVVSVGVGTWSIIDKLDPDDLKVILGYAFALATVVIVGALFIFKDAIQASLIRRALRDDDLSDMQQMALYARLAQGGNAGRVNVTLPPWQQQSDPALLPPSAAWQSQPWPGELAGAYRDTTVAKDIEVE